MLFFFFSFIMPMGDVPWCHTGNNMIFNYICAFSSYSSIETPYLKVLCKLEHTMHHTYQVFLKNCFINTQFFQRRRATKK